MDGLSCKPITIGFLALKAALGIQEGFRGTRARAISRADDITSFYFYLAHPNTGKL